MSTNDSKQGSAREARFVREGVSLAPYTTFRIGGNADYFVEVKSREELAEALAFARAHNIPYFVLGGGSNLLVCDEGFRGLVIYMHICGMTQEVDGERVRVTVGAGEGLDGVVQYAVQHGLWGIENLSSIPGTIGGAAVQNAGAYGVELASSIDSVTVYDTKMQKICVLERGACQYGYRDSIFKREPGRYIIAEVVLQLSKRPCLQITYKDLAAHFAEQEVTLVEIRHVVRAIRAAKFPDLAHYGTAGSFFMNPVIALEDYQTLQGAYPDMPSYPVSAHAVKVPVAWILDHVLHMKGERIGTVGAWEMQPLVITNYGDATAREVHAFAQDIVRRVKEATGITLVKEVVSLTC